MENIVDQSLNQLVCNRAISSGKWPAYLENIKKKDLQLILWAGSFPYSSGTGPARLVLRNRKRVTEKIKETVKKELG